MSDALRLYQTISKLINDMLPDMLEANRITLAQMVTYSQRPERSVQENSTEGLVSTQKA